MGKVENPIKCDIVKGRLPNHHFKFEIDTTPTASNPKWALLKAGINNLTQSLNEVLDQSTDLDGDGWANTIVTGGQLIWTFTGDRVYGDEAQDYIFKQALEFGCSRITNFRATAPNGDVIEGNVSIVNVMDASGEASTKGEISFEIHFNGKPDFIKAVSVGV